MNTRHLIGREAEAQRTGIGVRTLDREVRENGWPFIRIGRRVLFDPALSDEFLAKRTFRGRTGELAKQAA